MLLLQQKTVPCHSCTANLHSNPLRRVLVPDELLCFPAGPCYFLAKVSLTMAETQPLSGFKLVAGKPCAPQYCVLFG